MSEIASQWAGVEPPKETKSSEIVLPDGLKKWAKAHAAIHPEISVLPDNIKKYPEQLSSTVITRERLLPKVLPDTLVSLIKRLILKSNLQKNIGNAALGNYLKAFKSSENGKDVGAKLQEILDSGKNVVLIAGHAESLVDLEYAHLSASIASNRHRGGIFLNKAMAWEGYGDRSMTSILSYTGDIYWVIPDSESTKKYSIPAQEAQVVNVNATKQFWADLKKAKNNDQGRLISVVPSGTSMEKICFEDQLKVLLMPPTTKTTKGVLSKADAIVPVAIYGDSMLVGDVIEFSELAKQERIEAVDRSIGQLAIMTSKLAKVPCEIAKERSLREVRCDQAIDDLMTEWMQFREYWTDEEAKAWKRKIRGYTRIKLGLLLGSDIDWSLFDKIYSSEKE